MRACYGQMSHPSRCSLHQEEFMFGEHPGKSEMPGSNSEMCGKFCDGLSSNIKVLSWSHYYLSWPNYCKGVHEQVDQSGASHDPDDVLE
jgi:hypothetical protein